MKENELKTKSREAYDIIREMILTGNALPGTRLILMDLEAKLGVGRGPIRDALLLLDKSGLVQNIPYKGAIVTLPPDIKEMEIIYQQRKEIELILALEALNKASKEDIKELSNLAQEMEKNSKNENYFFHIDRNFHRKLYQLSQMPHLLAVVEHLMDFIQTFLTTRTYSEEHIQLFNIQHKNIIEALLNKDEQKLIENLEKNIMIGLQFVHEEMQKYKKK